MKNFKAPLFYIIIIVLGISSCKKKDKEPDPDPTPVVQTTPTGTFMLHLHTNLDSNEVDSYNTVYTTDDGRQISLSMAQLYLSTIQLVKADGSTVDFSGKKILKVLDTETYLVGTAPVGNYKSIKFKVGLDPATNLLSPVTPSDSANLNKPLMWFGSTAQPDGYVFLNVQGKIDTTYNMSATVAQMAPFVFKIGTNANYKQVTMPDKNFSIAENQVQIGHIIIDYTQLFTGVQLNQATNLSVTTAADNSSAKATVIATNIPSMFSYEE